MVSRFPLWSALALASTLITALTGYAQDKEQCAAAYEEAQTAQLEQRFREARAHLVTCTQASCPSAISADCWRWLTQLEDVQPTLVVAARTSSGVDLVDVRLTLDGQPFEEAANGKAVPVDPGLHTLRVEADGYEPAEQAVVVREGEKARLIELVLKPIGSADTPVSASAGMELPTVTPRRGVRPSVLLRAGYSLLGVGLVSGGLGSYFGWVGYDKGKRLRDTCKPNCEQGEVDAARMKLVVGHVLVGVGAAALATGLVTTLLGRAKERAPRRELARVRFDVALVPDGGVTGLSGRY